VVAMAMAMAMAVAPGRRDQGCEMIDQLQRGERQRRGAIAPGLGQALDDAFGVEQVQALERERRAGAVAQPPLQPDAIVRRDAHRGIQRKAAVLPSEHLADMVRLDQPAAGEPAQHPHAHLLGNDGEGLRCQLSGGAKAHGLRDSTGILDRLEDPVDDAAVVVNMAVEGGTEAVDEAHRRVQW
jgi:hypothetical protein